MWRAQSSLPKTGVPKEQGHCAEVVNVHLRLDSDCRRERGQ